MKIKYLSAAVFLCFLSTSVLWADSETPSQSEGHQQTGPASGLVENLDTPLEKLESQVPQRDEEFAIQGGLPTFDIALKINSPSSVFCAPSYTPDCYYLCHGGTCHNGQKCARRCYSPGDYCEPELLCVDACLD